MTTGATAFTDGDAMVAAAVAPSAEPAVIDSPMGEYPFGVVLDVNAWYPTAVGTAMDAAVGIVDAVIENPAQMYPLGA